MSSLSNEMTVNDVWEITKSSALSGWTSTKSIALLGWSKITKRIRTGLVMVFVLILTMLLLTPTTSTHTPTPPTLSLDYGKSNAPKSPYNPTRVALLIENRKDPVLAPLLLHFMSVVPPDWRFRFMGTRGVVGTVAYLNSSRAIRDAVAMGKLDLTYIPKNMTTGSQEEISQFLTTLWLYETVLAPAENLLIFQTDSMLCANSRRSLNDYLDYDWIGAPWSPNGRFGGNGGLSLRKVSAIIDVLRNHVRAKHDEPEDVWLTDRLGHRPNAKLANGTTSLMFSGEMHSGDAEKVGKGGGNGAGLVKGLDDWRNGFYEPMGYHTGGSGGTLHSGIWGTPAMRRHIWGYCPEMKITLKMDAMAYVPGDCKANWKRDGRGGGQTEWIDGVEYPLLPEGVVPW